MLPLSLGITTFTSPAAEFASAVQLNRTLAYIGSKGLTTPLRSSIVRDMFKIADKGSGVVALAVVDAALFDGLITEYQAIKKGECSASF